MSDRPLTSRRAALGGTAAGLVVLTGCDLLGSDPNGSQDAPAPGDPGATAGGREGPDDVALVSQALTELATMAALVSAVRRRHRTLAASLQPVLATHRAHAATLTGTTGDQPPSITAKAPADRDRAWQRIRTRELRLQRRLVAFSMEARSGALAGLLASMSAAVAQQLVVLPAGAPPVTPEAATGSTGGPG